MEIIFLHLHNVKYLRIYIATNFRNGLSPASGYGYFSHVSNKLKYPRELKLLYIPF